MFPCALIPVPLSLCRYYGPGKGSAGFDASALPHSGRLLARGTFLHAGGHQADCGAFAGPRHGTSEGA